MTHFLEDALFFTDLLLFWQTGKKRARRNKERSGVLYLIDELLEVRRGRIDALQIVVQRKLGERLPGRGEGVHLDGIHAAPGSAVHAPAGTAAHGPSAAASSARRRLAVPHGTRRYERDALHRAESQLPSVLWPLHRRPSKEIAIEKREKMSTPNMSINQNNCARLCITTSIAIYCLYNASLSNKSTNKGNRI